MTDSSIISKKRCFFLFYGLILGLFALSMPLLAQIPLSIGAYKSNQIMGDWQDPDSWLTWDGNEWVLPALPPDRTNDVFILQGHEIRLTGNQEVNNLYLFGHTSPGRKLNLQLYEVHIYGGLHSFQITDDTFYLYNSTSPTADWIYPESGAIVFKGGSRTIVDRTSWSAQTNLSRFRVIFDPDPGETLTVNAAIKANFFEIRSGTVFQRISSNGSLRSSTFSFNIHDSFGSQDYGTLIIRSGATLISEVSNPQDQIIRRTENRPASSFILEAGATLELLGAAPQLDAVDVQLLGTVLYSGTGSQQALAHTFPQSLPITQYQHLSIETEGIFSLPENLLVGGDLSVSPISQVLTDNTLLSLNGEYDQEIFAEGVEWNDLSINNSFGTVSLQHDLVVNGNFEMLMGNVDFLGNQLYLNVNEQGNYTFHSGSWKNLSRLNYVHLPALLDHQNSSFPFFDEYLGEPRMLKLLGNASTTSGLSISYQQNEGVNHNAQITDNDGSRILYHLNSYFEIEGLVDNSGTAELWIQASDMILDDIADLRITGIGEPAEGYHLEADLAMAEIWGKRQVNLSELGGNTFTLSSTGEFSILPLVWESAQLAFDENRAYIQWKTKSEPGTIFYILKSYDGLKFSLLDSIEVVHDGDHYNFSFSDPTANRWQPITYYKILAKTMEGLYGESPVYRLNGQEHEKNKASIFPNPYEGGNIQLLLPFTNEFITLMVIDQQGRVALKWSGEAQHLNPEELVTLPASNYLLIFITDKQRTVLKWIKRTVP